MFGQTYGKFQLMRPSVRALVFLYWTNALASGIIGAFTQIFLYQKFTSISLNIEASIIAYTGLMIGFGVPGLFAAFWRMNVKHGFIWSFFLTGIAIVYLLQGNSILEAFIAMFLWGLGQGMFWLTVNTFELVETNNNERDFYSSVLNAGTQILSLVGPAIGTLLIWLSESVFHTGTYTLLFTITPAVYLLGLFCFAHISEYRPQPLQWADLLHYLTDRKNQAAQLYTFGTGIQQILGTTVPPLAILLILGTALSVGIYNTIFAIFSAACILVLAQYRTPTNRIRIYGITVFGIALATVWFGYAFSLTALVLYTIVEGILSPIQRVTSHVIDLDAMEIGRSDTDFYATMILRDFFLWFWRCLGGVLFLVLIQRLNTAQEALIIGLYCLAAAHILTYFGAALFKRIG